MDFKEIEEKNLNFYAPRFEVEIEGKNLLRNGVPITSVEVIEKLNDSARFSIQINDHFDVTTETFEWLDNPLFQVGKMVTIKMGYGANLQTMLIGRIENINSSLFSTASPTLGVEGYDLAYDFLKKPSDERTFDNVKDSDIVQTLAGKIGLTSVVDPTTVIHEKVIKKSDTSYFNFLKERAARVGYEFYVGARTLYFVIPKEDKAELFTLEWGKNLMSFNPTMSTAGVVTEVEERWWDSKNKKEIIGRARAGDERTQEKGKKKASEIAREAGKGVKKVIFWPVSSAEEATNVAKAGINKASDSFIEGSGTTIGIPELRAGVIIGLNKLGRRFSGKYRVKEATHTIDTNGYKVNFTGKRNAV
jgi:phage protein D